LDRADSFYRDIVDLLQRAEVEAQRIAPHESIYRVLDDPFVDVKAVSGVSIQILLKNIAVTAEKLRDFYHQEKDIVQAAQECKVAIKKFISTSTMSAAQIKLMLYLVDFTDLDELYRANKGRDLADLVTNATQDCVVSAGSNSVSPDVAISSHPALRNTPIVGCMAPPPSASNKCDRERPKKRLNAKKFKVDNATSRTKLKPKKTHIIEEGTCLPHVVVEVKNSELCEENLQLSKIENKTTYEVDEDALFDAQGKYPTDMERNDDENYLSDGSVNKDGGSCASDEMSGAIALKKSVKVVEARVSVVKSLPKWSKESLAAMSPNIWCDIVRAVIPVDMGGYVHKIAKSRGGVAVLSHLPTLADHTNCNFVGVYEGEMFGINRLHPNEELPQNLAHVYFDRSAMMRWPTRNIVYSSAAAKLKNKI
jgi:hypothetical protein